jgi:PHP family Zn ribbon phosphoesterase
VELNKIRKIDSQLAKLIESYRDNTIKVISGRGGQYGKIVV